MVPAFHGSSCTEFTYSGTYTNTTIMVVAPFTCAVTGVSGLTVTGTDTFNLTAP